MPSDGELIPDHPSQEDPGQSIGSDNEDAQSVTSTEAYSDYEPFSTFKDKVLDLCRILWPTYAEGDFLIDRIKGGASNRIVSISVSPKARERLEQSTGEESEDLPPGEASNRIVNISVSPTARETLERSTREESEDLPPGEASNRSVSISVSPTARETLVERSTREDLPDLPPGDYILRIPRWSSQTSSHEMEMLRFLKERLSLNVPTVVRADKANSPGNPLGVTYVLQVRIPGQRLDCVWPCLNHTQRLLITLDLARLLADLAKIGNPSCGIPDVESGLAEDGTLNTTKPYFPGDDRDSMQLASPQPPIQVLYQRLARWDARYRNFGPSWSHAAEIVSHIHATNDTFGLGPGGSPYYLQHGDLFPRNIMVQTSGQDVALVTGILDWDDAVFTPAVVAFSPPAWLWMPGWWTGCDDDGWLDTEDLWRGAHREPEDQHCRAIKNLFDLTVGPEYLQHAYAPDAHAARRIWQAAHENVGSSWTQQQLDELYETWQRTRNSRS